MGTVLSNALNGMIATGMCAPNPGYHNLIMSLLIFSSFRGHSQESLSDHLSARNISVPCAVWFVHSDLECSLVLTSSPVLGPLLLRICSDISVICTCYRISIVPHPSLSGVTIMTVIYIDLPQRATVCHCNPDIGCLSHACTLCIRRNI